MTHKDDGGAVLPTVAEFFAQYAEKGHIFPDGGLKVRFHDGDEGLIMLIEPSHAVWEQSIVNNYSARLWRIDGTYRIARKHKSRRPQPHDCDIIAVLDDAGNVIAGRKQ